MAAPTFLVWQAPSTSIFAETHARAVRRAIEEGALLGDAIDGVSPSTDFYTCDPSDGGHCSGGIGEQLAAAARVIKARDVLGLERAAFFAKMAGNDAHATFDSPGQHFLQQIDNAVDSFRQEMELEGLWADVTVVTLSEFGRTISSNGRGTDHAWGGNQVIYGGAVNGTRLLGEFPAKLGEHADNPVALGGGRILPTLSCTHRIEARNQARYERV